MDNGRVFRQHWFVKVALPGLPWFGFIVLISLAVLYLLPHSHYAPWLFFLAVFPLLKLIRLYLAWLGYSVSVVAGLNMLRERSGILNVSEHLIPLTEFGPVTFERPWWASLFGIDVADIIIVAMGGPFVLSSMGDFSDFWIVLQSRGQTVPPKHPSALAVLPGLLSRSAFTGFDFVAYQPSGSLSATAKQPGSVSLRHRVRNDGYVYRGAPFSPLIPSYAGFCAFCQQFILTDKNWMRSHYCARDSNRRYYPDGISNHIAYSYLSRLRQECILVPGPNGCSGERLSVRIRSIQDIERLIPDLSESLNKTV